MPIVFTDNADHKVWELIDSVNNQANDKRQKRILLSEKLAQLPNEDIVMFDVVIRHLRYKVERWDLFAVNKIFCNMFCCFSNKERLMYYNIGKKKGNWIGFSSYIKQCVLTYM